jgi:hypothetical protein
VWPASSGLSVKSHAGSLQRGLVSVSPTPTEESLRVSDLVSCVSDSEESKKVF